MAALIPHAKAIVMLRDPIDRAYSHYWQERRFDRETLSFRDALAVESDRIARGQQHFAYLGTGRYLPQLERLCTFYPRKSVHVIIFEDFTESPEASFASVCRFLGIDDTFVPRGLDRRYNAYREAKRGWLAPLERKDWFRYRLPAGLRRRISRWTQWRPVEYEPLDPELRERLAEDNRVLARWLDIDRMPWDAPRPSSHGARPGDPSLT